MVVAEMKKTKSDLITWIQDLSDINMLTALESLKNSNNQSDWWDDLSESQRLHIDEGLKDIENGNVHASAIFWDKLKNG